MADDVGALIAHARTGARIRPLPRRVALAALRGIELAGGTPLGEWHQCAARGEASIVATDRAERLLGWQPRWSNADALIAAYDWYAARTAAGAAAPATHAVPALHRLVGRIAGRSGGH
jgi:hypothetical protein